MKITFNEKEYSIKFGYKATVKSGIIKKLAKAENSDNDGFESIEERLLILPEMLVVGLQVHHADEFGYNIDTNEGYQEKVDKAFDVIEKYLETKENSIVDLFNGMENELLNDSFLSSLFQSAQTEEQKKTPQKATKKK